MNHYQPEFYKTTLENGVRVVTETHPYSKSVSVGVWIDKGSRDENRGQEGVAHFLEHLVFKGTYKRSAFEIAKSLEAVGGDLNACTSKEYTCFHATCLAKDLELAVDVLIDLVTEPLFSEEDFTKEKNVIFQEMQMTQDNLEEYIFDLFFEKSFSKSIFGTSILGTSQSIKNLKRSDLFLFKKNNYVGPHIIVSAAGPIDHKKVVEMVLKRVQFDHKKISATSRKNPKFKPIKKEIIRQSEQSHLLLGFPTVSFLDEYRFESYILHTLLGGGMTSRLYQKIREKRGLVYSIYSVLNTFTDCGFTFIYAGADPSERKKVLNLIIKEILNLKSKGVKEKELEFYKNQVKGQIWIGSDDVENRMNSLAVNEMVFGRYRPIEEIMCEIDQVTLKRLHQFIEEYVDLDKFGLILLGGSDGNKRVKS